MKSHIAVFVLFMFAAAANAFAAVPVETGPIMGLEELQKLLDAGPVTASFYTVPEGKPFDEAAIRRYDGVQIRGVYGRLGMKIIMFATRHYIVAGMSGSPVYVNGRKIGALAYRFSEFPPPGGLWWGGISPIEFMQEEAERLNAKTSSFGMPRTFSFGGKTFSAIPSGTESVPRRILDRMLAAGADPQTVEALAGMKFFASTSVVNAAQSQPAVQCKRHELKPGMPIAVDVLQWTDDTGATITWCATGTVTHVDAARRVYAFGHPFLGLGNVRYSFRGARILGTVYSQSYSYKLGNADPETLGTIGYDGDYGVYGTHGTCAEKPFPGFTIAFEREGTHYRTMSASVMECSYTPFLIQIALEIFGDVYKAPRGEDPVMTEMKGTIGIAGHGTVAANQTFYPATVAYGADIFHISSYTQAVWNFAENIYVPLFVANNYNLKPERIMLAANFIRGTSNKLTLVSGTFPETVAFGKKPVLELTFVNQDNTALVTKRVAIELDWQAIGKLFPVVAAPANGKKKKDSENGDGKPPSPLRGRLATVGPQRLYFVLTDRQKAELEPNFFLNADDYVAAFAERLTRVNRMYIQVAVYADESTDISQTESSTSVVSGAIGAASDPWNIVPRGLTEHIIPPASRRSFTMLVPLPPIPGRYVIEQDFMKIFPFFVSRETHPASITMGTKKVGAQTQKH